MKILFCILSVVCFIHICFTQKAWKDEEETEEYWKDLARMELEESIRLQQHNMNVARNVIMFLGDGMGVPTITAGRILKGQMQGNSGEETILAMDKFAHAGLSKTYSVDRQVSDSACTATAYLCGVKSKDGTVGLTGKVEYADCSSSKGNEVDSILVDAYNAGKSTGVVTTTRINHASPSGTYAHSASRQWYSNDNLPEEAVENGCKDIAQQFLDSSHMMTVTLGGGRRHFQPNTTRDPEYNTYSNMRTDGQDLVEQWKQMNENNNWNYKYVWNKSQFDSVDTTTTDRLLGLFEPSDMRYEVDRTTKDGQGEPSLAEMTEKAIRMLRKNSKGFFLFVEGGRIDHGHHGSNAYTALHDFVAFDNAIAKAAEMTSESDTLILVTADHSHTFNFGGYTDRGNPIFGPVISGGSYYVGLDGKPFTSLLYGNGEGYQGTNTTIVDPHSRENVSHVDTESRDYQQQSGVPLNSETHGGEDVAILASGPMAHLIHGVHQQSYIAYAMRYASCLGSDNRHCDGGSVITPPSPGMSTVATFLGLGLDSTDAEVALNVQFALIIILFVFSLIMTYVAMKKKKGISKELTSKNDYAL